jgi:hypothetical protein
MPLAWRRLTNLEKKAVLIFRFWNLSGVNARAIADLSYSRSRT